MIDYAQLVYVVVGALATVFFGGLLAGGAYLIRNQMALKEGLMTLQHRMDRLKAIEQAAEMFGSQIADTGALKDLLEKEAKNAPERR